MDTARNPLDNYLLAALRAVNASEAVARAAEQRWRAWLQAHAYVAKLRFRTLSRGQPSQLPERPAFALAAIQLVAGAMVAEKAARLERPCLPTKEKSPPPASSEPLTVRISSTGSGQETDASLM